MRNSKNRQRIEDYLRASRPKDVARELGVDESTISRWKNGKPIARDHFLKLAQLAGIGPDELPDTDSLPHARGRATRPNWSLDRTSIYSPPGKIAGLFIQSLQPLPESQFDLLDKRLHTLAALLEQPVPETIKAHAPHPRYRMGFGQNWVQWVQYPRTATKSNLLNSLDAATDYAGPGDLIMVFVSCILSKNEGKLFVGPEADPQRNLTLVELVDRLNKTQHKCLLAIQARNGDTGTSIDQMYEELCSYGRPGLAAICAELPSKTSELIEWPFFDERFLQDISDGKADRNQDGQITAAELYQLFDRRIETQKKSFPRLLFPEPYDSQVVLGARLDLASKLSGERALFIVLQEKLGINASLPQIYTLTQPDSHPAGTPLPRLREAALKLGAPQAQVVNVCEKNEAETLLRSNVPLIVYGSAPDLCPEYRIACACAVTVDKVSGQTVSYFTPNTTLNSQRQHMDLNDFLSAWEEFGYLALRL